MKSKVNILGTEYTINHLKKENDPKLNDYDGYCDVTTKRIVICDFETDPNSVEDLDAYKNSVLRHEIVHAFMFESGLKSECPFANDEVCVDWIALQSPKMFKLWQEMGVL